MESQIALIVAINAYAFVSGVQLPSSSQQARQPQYPSD